MAAFREGSGVGVGVLVGIGVGGDCFIETKDSSGVVVTTNSYDTLGRKVSTKDSDLGLWTYVYDPNGSLKTQTDPMGNVTKIEYDSLNRVKRKLFNDAEVLAYSYDSGNNARGRRSKFSDKHQTTNYQYDSRGRLVLVEKSFDGKDLENLFGGSAYTSTFSYDNLDRQVAITYPSTDAFEPETVNFSFDGPYLKSVMGENTYVSDITYNLFGQVIEKRLGNNVIESYAYDPLSQRLDSLSYNSGQSDIVSLQYAYSPVGNITKITDDLNYGDDSFSMTQSFNYDSFYRLTSSTGTGFSTSYSYDDTDRMLKKTVGQDSYAYGYNQNFPYHAIKNINIGGVSQGTEYDQSGNLLSYRVGDLERDINWDYSIGKPETISLVDYSVPTPSPTPTEPVPTSTPTPTDTPVSTSTPTDVPVTTTPIPTTQILLGDANGDGKVDGADFVIWLTHYSQDVPNGARDGDFDENGKVDGGDFVIWLMNYGNTALGPVGGDGSVGKSTESAVVEGDTLAETTGPVQFYYDGEGGRLAKLVDNDNYTIYPNAYINKVVEKGSTVWKKFYIVGGEIVAIRVYENNP